jgi:hypothetical protein
MGFFKDLRTLRKQGREAYRTFDPAAGVRQAKEAMADAGRVMEQQAAAAALAANGKPGTAQVNTARDTGTMMNLQPVVEIDLLVFLQGQPPYPITVSQVVPVAQVGRLVPGARLTVKVDRAAPDKIWIDWAQA